MAARDASSATPRTARGGLGARVLGAALSRRALLAAGAAECARGAGDGTPADERRPTRGGWTVWVGEDMAAREAKIGAEAGLGASGVDAAAGRSRTRIALESWSRFCAVSMCSRRRTQSWTTKAAQIPTMTRKIRLLGCTKTDGMPGS